MSVLSTMSSSSSSRSKRIKIFVGLDYGTTYSGVSYVTGDRSSDKIMVIDQWPDSNGAASKAPTRIAYASDNPSRITQDQWGFSARPGWKSYSWTKLLLDKDAMPAAFDDEKLQSLYGHGMMALPPGKSAGDVCHDYLKGLYRHVVDRIKRNIGPEIFDASPVECWVTVPAIWLPKAQQATKEAARRAGFGARPYDSIHVITEPEAGALAALKPYTVPDAVNALRPGENVLVCDCGGGTVDITTYTITAIKPRMEFEDLCPGVGGKCGSTFIDRNFHEWMIKTFGSAYTNVAQKDRGPGSRFMESFEGCKKRFSGLQDNRPFEVGPIRMNTSSAKYDGDEAMVILSLTEMKALFDPVINKIRDLVESQVAQADCDKNKSIDRLILVGGFSDSAYLYQELKSWCRQNGDIDLVTTDHPQSAVARGAAIRGLEGTKPKRTYSRFHYGYAALATFQAGVDLEKYAEFDEFYNKKMCLRMNWFIDKGTAVVESQKFSTVLHQTVADGEELKSTFGIYTTAQDVPPRWPTDACVEQGSVLTTFASGDVNVAESRWSEKSKKLVRSFSYDMNHIITEGSSLAVETMAYGRRAGSATFSVDLG